MQQATTREGVRSWLLLVALLGLGVSLFWGYLFEERSSTSSSSCPFASSSTSALAEAIDRLPNLPAPAANEARTGPCATCIDFNSLTFDVGSDVKKLFPRDQRAFTVEQMAKLLGNPGGKPFSSSSSPHVQQAITKLLQNKFTYWPSPPPPP